ncbi:kinase-like domain-containing protein [Lactarius hengduanensis]|nr:kinase-like domain-containing protein [Lactarius hengduanensis]
MPPFLQCGAKLLFNAPWPFSLAIEGLLEDVQYRYTPRSDFSIGIEDFLYLLLSVSSGKPHRGYLHRMLLQASCLVRLGNALLNDRSSTFFVKAIYIDRHYHVVEYTLYQRGSKPGNDEVTYSANTYNFSNKYDAFRLVFRLYNFLHSMRALHKKLSPPRLTAALSSILAEVEGLPYITGVHGSNGSSTQIGPESRVSSKMGATLRNPRVWAVIQRNGYTLLPEGSTRLKPTIGKAISHYGRASPVALKLLDSATEELQILERLHAYRLEANHTIQLLDVINLGIAFADRMWSVVVMPWQMTLAQCLGESYFPNGVESLRVQFLEGVSFLHGHGVAHLDLKPTNILVDGECGSPPPRLSIIDFGLSVFAESEDTLVEGYRGTPSWTAPEVGRAHGPLKKYSAILADRWSCGQVLLYFAGFLPADRASAFESTCARLLSLDPHERPSLNTVLQILRGTSAGKHGSEEGEPTVARKRRRSQTQPVLYTGAAGGSARQPLVKT